LRPAFRLRPLEAFFADLRAGLRDALRADFFAVFFLAPLELFFFPFFAPPPALLHAAGAAAARLRGRDADAPRARAPPEGRPGASLSISS
jgi:hypothetical protein